MLKNTLKKFLFLAFSVSETRILTIVEELLVALTKLCYVWLMFVFALFVIEPFFIKDHGRIVKDGRNFGNLYKTQVLHTVILALSLFTIFISVLGAHGFFS